MSVKLLTEHHLEFLSLKGGCTGSPESTLVKIPHCWKSHVMAQILNNTSGRECGEVFNKKTLRGVLESPNYPGDYPTNVSCVWKIRPSNNRRILVIIPDVDLEKADKCGDKLVMRKSSK